MKYFTSVLNQSSPPVSNTTKHLQKYADHYRVMRSWHVQPLNSQYGAASKKKMFILSIGHLFSDREMIEIDIFKERLQFCFVFLLHTTKIGKSLKFV